MNEAQHKHEDNKELQHRAFLERLKLSQDAVWKVARFMSGHDYVITIPPTHFAPTFEQRNDYKDHGDIWAVQSKYAKEPGTDHYQKVEVKHNDYVFTSYDDYPFTDIIVNSVDSHQRNELKPAMYFLLNFEMTHAAIIKVASTEEMWYVKNKISPHTNVAKDYYACPLDMATWVRL